MIQKLSKKDITQFKNQLEQKKQKIITRIGVLKKSDPFSDPDHATDNAAIDTDVREQIGHETIVAEVEVSNKTLFLIETALKKIARGLYGVCEKCRLPIGLNRLKIVPETRYCLDCEKKLIK